VFARLDIIYPSSFNKLYDESVEKNTHKYIQVEDIQFISALDIPVRSVTLIKSEDM